MATERWYASEHPVVPHEQRSGPQVLRLPTYDELVSPRQKALGGRDRTRRRLLVLADALGLLAAYACSRLAASGAGGTEEALIVLGCLPLSALLMQLLGLYDRDLQLIHSGTLDEVPRIALAVFITVASIFIFVLPVTGADVGRGHAVLLMAFGLISITTLRSAARTAVRRSYPPERCLIVGSGVVARLLARKIAGHPEYGVMLVGLVDATPNGTPDAAALDAGDELHRNGHDRDGAQWLGDHARFVEVCHEFSVERIVIAFTTLGHEDLLKVVATSKALDLKVSVVPRLFEAMGRCVEVDQIEGMTLLGVRGVSRSRSAVGLKRALDVSLAGGALIVAGPLLAAIALVIKLTSQGPALFAQERIGRDNRPFRMLKFRTMVHDADDLKPQFAHLNEAEGPMFKIADDPRLTAIGRRLRRMSLDELPQLWNVLRGEMSLVGPRPLVPNEDHHVIGRHRDRLKLAPGLTGPWQVLGRTAIPFQEMVKLDYLYVAEWSLWNDVKLLLRTVPVMLRAGGS